MCLIRCDVRFRTAQSGGSGVCGRPGHHRQNRQQEPDGDRYCGETGCAGGSTWGAEESSPVYGTRSHGTEDVQLPGTDNRITEADHGPPNTTILASGLRSLDVRATAGVIEARVGRGQEDPEICRNGRGTPTRTGQYDMGRQTIGRRSVNFEDAVSQCAILTGPGSPDSPQATSATTPVSVWNTRVFRTALTALTEPRTLWQRIRRDGSRCIPPLRRLLDRASYSCNASRCILLSPLRRQASFTLRPECGDIYAPSERHVCYTLRKGCSYAVAVYTTPGDVNAYLRPRATCRTLIYV